MTFPSFVFVHSAALYESVNWQENHHSQPPPLFCSCSSQPGFASSVSLCFLYFCVPPGVMSQLWAISEGSTGRCWQRDKRGLAREDPNCRILSRVPSTSISPQPLTGPNLMYKMHKGQQSPFNCSMVCNVVLLTECYFSIEFMYYMN